MTLDNKKHLAIDNNAYQNSNIDGKHKTKKHTSTKTSGK